MGAVLARRTADPRSDPWRDSGVRYDADDHARTLDVLARTCSVALNPDVPVALLRARAYATQPRLTAAPEPARVDAA